VPKNYAEAVKWFRTAAEQNEANAQRELGLCYSNGEGVRKDYVEAVKWFRKAAERNVAMAQSDLGVCYANGQGVPKDYVEGYKWFLLAAAQGVPSSELIASAESRMSREQIAEGQKLAREFKPRQGPSASGDSSGATIAQTRPTSSGNGFFITEDG
jgi:TPR repeat protein